MFESIILHAQESDYDFRRHACPSDPLKHLFDEWANCYKVKWAISHSLKPASILEIGVRFGYSAAAFLHGNPDAWYVGIDLDSNNYGGLRGAVKWAKEITEGFAADFIIADSQALERLPGGIYDLVHIDGQQDGDGSFHDLELALNQARYVLVDGYFWTPTNFAAVNEFLFRYRDLFDFYGVIPGYAGELLIKVSDHASRIGGAERRSAIDSSLDIRPAYTSEYYLQDCGGFDSYKKYRGKELEDLRLQAVAAIASLRNRKRVLDIGCGRGELVYHFAKRGFAVTAVDYSADAIALSQKCFEGEEELKARVDFRQSDISTVLLQSQYDLVIASDMIEHLTPAELEMLYKQVSDLLAPDGLFVVHTYPNLWYYKYGYPRRRRSAASVGAYLPAQPRSRYEMLMHINEQSPRVLKRQLSENFQHVVMWFGSLANPGGSLVETFHKEQMRTTEDLFAVASNSPIDQEQIKAVFWTTPLPAITSRELELIVRDCPANVTQDSRFDVFVEIRNNSCFTLSSSQPYPVNLSYHWVEEETSTVVVFDGERTRLFPPLGPVSTESYTARVKAPEQSGRHILRLTLVQEAVRWFDETPPMVSREVWILAS